MIIKKKLHIHTSFYIFFIELLRFLTFKNTHKRITKRIVGFSYFEINFTNIHTYGSIRTHGAVISSFQSYQKRVLYVIVLTFSK